MDVDFLGRRFGAREDTMTVLVERGDLVRLLAMAESRTARMAQAAARPAEISERTPSPANRLLGISTNAILDRILVDPVFRKGFDRLLMKGGAFSSVAIRPRWPIPEGALAELTAISKAPTPEEISDLAIADHFYGDYRFKELLQREVPDPKRALRIVCGGRKEVETIRALFPSLEGVNWNLVAEATRSNRFYCPGAPGFRTTIQLDNIQFFGLSDAIPWARARQYALNVMNLLKVWESYPWPAIVHAYPPAWRRVEQPGLRTLVKQEAPLVKDMIRFWITLATVADYNRIAAIVQKELKEKAKKERINAIITTVAFAAIGAILTAGVALAFTGAAGAGAASTGAAAGTTASFTQVAVTKGLSFALSQVQTSEKEKAAEALQDAAKQLQSTDPGFAKEVDWSSEYLKYVIALEAVEEKDRREGLPPGTTTPPRAPTPPGVAEDKGLTAAVGLAVPALVSVAAAVLKTS